MANIKVRPPANRFVAVARKVYNPIGFSKGYNFVFFFIFVGAFTGFTLARLQYLALDRSCTTGSGDQRPLDCYYYTEGSVDRVGILLHLGTILPAALLACLQFVPVIRRTFVLFHRINGYLILVLSVVSTAGAFMLSRHAVGGRLDAQMVIGTVSVAFIVSLGLAYYNVKRLQIEQHRAWMLRAWFYAGSIITMRIIMFLSSLIVSDDGYDVPMPCAKVAAFTGSHQQTLQSFPECDVYFSRQDVNKMVLVPASMTKNGANTIAIMSMAFGPALWLALALHAVGIEVYLHLTPAEANRLRNVSYQRQLEAGMKHPGRAGLTADRIGDSPLWVPGTQHEPANDSSGEK
ncbi:hypothetical protein N657DRAFT_658546 [Parathielavia appendiculata]|uniref:Microtubule associated protein n=1 Tax=Parathielavia appendiculata TaxID=2587402 RepID=A0AAN6TT18_9PEZI|nr:hypothetical protein N657DRAFT_658546 [Parathielavia appendiculata]